MTELIWQGKYDKNGKRVMPVRLSLPFQTVETVNETPIQRAATLDMFSAGKPTEWRNRLIWGDKKYVLPSLLEEFAGKVNLIYIDPPFNTGADFSFTTKIGAASDTDAEGALFTKEPSILEQKAYRDTWGKGLDSYLQWFYETVVLLRELLADNGSIYVHLDWRLIHYAKIVMDEVFSMKYFTNEIIWQGTKGDTSSKNKKFIKSHETIVLYSKTDKKIWNEIFQAYSEGGEAPYKYEDEKGRYRWCDCSNPGGGGYIYDLGYNEKPPFGGYRMPKKTALKWIEEGLLKVEAGKVPRYKRYMNPEGVRCKDVWTDITATQGAEYRNYPTQKPEALLERIIKASSNEGDLVLDCFCGSGTTAAVSEKLGRRWITCDLGRFAIHTTRKRLLAIERLKPFVVQNLGKYERQAWLKESFADAEDRLATEKRYRNFIIALYKGEIIDNYVWIHGSKSGRLVHVGAVDAPVTQSDIIAAIKEFWSIAGQSGLAKTNELDILGWDFALELNETAKQAAAEHNIKLHFKKIPREVLEKSAVEKGDITFSELTYLAASVHRSADKRLVTVTLEDFIINPDDIPEGIEITHWSQFIDYWAVDFNYRNDTFHNEWQSYRTRKSNHIELSVTHEYAKAGDYVILIKVIDILGNDTTKVLY